MRLQMVIAILFPIPLGAASGAEIICFTFEILSVAASKEDCARQLLLQLNLK